MLFFFNLALRYLSCFDFAMNKIKFFLLFTGLVLSFVPFLYSNIWPFKSLETPIELKTGTVLEKSFKASHSTRYDLEISASEKDSSPRAECLLTGQNHSQQSCQGLPSRVGIAWELFKDSVVVESGTVIGDGATQSAGQGQISRLLGWADLEAGEEYTLKVKSLKDFPELTEYEPKLSLTTNAGFFKDHFFKFGLTQLIGYLLIAVSVGIEFYQRFLHKKPA